MAARNVSNIPFEQRFQSPNPRRRKHERLTVTDRLVCAACGAFLGFVIWTVAYLILFSVAIKVAGRQEPAAKVHFEPLEKLPPFWWGSSIALGFSLFGAIVGAERMMDGFEKVIRVEGEVARAVSRH